MVVRSALCGTVLEIDSAGDGIVDHRIVIDNGEFMLFENNGMI